MGEMTQISLILEICVVSETDHALRRCEIKLRARVCEGEQLSDFRRSDVIIESIVNVTQGHLR